RRIGYACLFLFVYGFMHRLLSFLIVRSSISLEDYKITFSMSGYSYLITGLLVLLFAELLNISHRIKEENDLTI
ncbi:MAG: DUF2975 domain-containing protein, partial [Dysgonamonadaceae bacterium]|nr:DUF2975 domain-containing protein [Dysgonamonadaceae bacterium]